MKTTIILKADKDVKDKAQKTAKNLGLTLSAVINASLKQFIRTQKVSFSMEPQLNQKTIRELTAISKDIKEGKNLVSFNNIEDFISHLKSRSR